MTWLDLAEHHPFSVAHLPYGVYSTTAHPHRIGVRVGDDVLDVAAVAEADQRTPDLARLWRSTDLNLFLGQGRTVWARARAWLTEVLTDAAHRDLVEGNLVPVDEVTLHLPVAVADYVDFYASEHHASNVGRIFRPGGEPLTPNWKHVPIGYHGRAGTVVVSGTDVARPSGQRKRPDETVPTLGPTRALDFEAELGFVVGGPTKLGRPVRVEEADDHIFGVVLLNDWSARDIQAWEYVPLGPFLGKSFATSISGWITPWDALARARMPLPAQDPRPLDYLGPGTPLQGLDIECEVRLNGTTISRPPYREMYWSPAQMIAHMTINGASLRPGDLFGSGTISGPDDGTLGSLLELTRNGARPLQLADGTTRAFLADGDTIALHAWATGLLGHRIELGEVVGTVREAS